MEGERGDDRLRQLKKADGKRTKAQDNGWTAEMTAGGGKTRDGEKRRRSERLRERGCEEK